MKEKRRRIFHGKVISVSEDTFKLHLERCGKAYIAEIKNEAIDGHDIIVGLELDWIVNTDNTVTIDIKKQKPSLSNEELKKLSDENMKKYGHFFK